MEVIWTPKALKQLTKLKDRQARKRIVLAVGALSGFPDVPGVKTLKNHQSVTVCAWEITGCCSMC